MGNPIKSIGKGFEKTLNLGLGVAAGSFDALQNAVKPPAVPGTPASPSQVFQAAQAPLTALIDQAKRRLPPTLLTSGQSAGGTLLGRTSLLGG